MAIEKILIEQFLQLSKQHPVLDVRSPGEYEQAHIAGAHSLPLFTNEERKIVGTAYKQQSREVAIKIGLDYFGIKMRAMVEKAESLGHKDASKVIDNATVFTKQPASNKQTILVHCWRGGMRSAGVAWLLDLYGFKVYLLAGGYKAYRKWVREQFEQPYNLTVVGGFTGAGKTLVLHELQQTGHSIIDLENLAQHKGSAFGGLGENGQPTQEMFENLLAENLATITAANGIIDTHLFIEDESQRIGRLNIPDNFWNRMRQSPILFLDISFEDRLDLITTIYGNFNKVEMGTAIARLQKRLGGQETKMAIHYLKEDNYKDCFSILLKYYDKYYQKGLEKRENLASLLKKITGSNKAIKEIAQQLIAEKMGVQ